MCNKCNKNSCTGCAGTSNSNATGNAQIEAILAELQEQIDTLIESTKAFACGHPILLIENANDIVQFNGEGLGSGCWDKWAICNGETHINPVTKKPFVTPNFTDRFIVQAGGTYAVDDTGGSDTVQLITAELPAHNHGITDPGHTHDIQDPGHNHAVTDPGHTHQAIADPHHHFATLAMGNHTHDVRDYYQDDARLGAITAAGLGVDLFLNNSPDIPGSQTIASSNETYITETTDSGTGGTATGYTDNATQQITLNASFTGVHVDNAFIGITETETEVTDIITNDEGGDQPHENRPPFFAAFYVIKYY